MYIDYYGSIAPGDQFPETLTVRLFKAANEEVRFLKTDYPASEGGKMVVALLVGITLFPLQLLESILLLIASPFILLVEYTINACKLAPEDLSIKLQNFSTGLGQSMLAILAIFVVGGSSAANPDIGVEI